MRIARQLSKKKSSEQVRLHQQHPSHADLITEHRVGRVLGEPPLERLDKAPPAALRQSGPRRGHDEIIRPHLARIDGGATTESAMIARNGSMISSASAGRP